MLPPMNEKSMQAMTTPRPFNSPEPNVWHLSILFFSELSLVFLCTSWCLRKTKVFSRSLGRLLGISFIKENPEILITANSLVVVTHGANPIVVLVVLV